MTNHAIPEIVRGLKTFSSRKINETKTFHEKFHWKRTFYERIIRNEDYLSLVRKYIQQNPLKMKLDE